MSHLDKEENLRGIKNPSPWECVVHLLLYGDVVIEFSEDGEALLLDPGSAVIEFSEDGEALLLHPDSAGDFLRNPSKDFYHCYRDANGRIHTTVSDSLKKRLSAFPEDSRPEFPSLKTVGPEKICND